MKQTYYQRKKAEHAQQIKDLTQQIITLVENKDYLKVEEIKHEWRFKLLQAEVYMNGSPTFREKLSELGFSRGSNGIIDHYENLNKDGN